VRRLGGGSMGRVYEAHDRATGSRVALAAVGLGGFASAVRWQLQHVLGSGAGDGAPWHGATLVRPDRLAHTLAPLPVY
jgi:hypothetical protein